MSEPMLSQLLDRAVEDAPQMHVASEDVLAAGKGRVRRRRVVGAGSVLGAAAIVASVWGGLSGGDGTLTGMTEIQPATTVWDPGVRVTGTLFDDLQSIDADQVAHSYDAQLSRPSGEGPVTLVLSDNGAVVEEIEARSPVPGLEVFTGDRMTVAVWRQPEGAIGSVPLVGPVDPGGPSGTMLTDTEGVTDVQGDPLAYAVWANDVVAQPEEVLDVYLVGTDDAVTLSGQPVETVVLHAGGERAVAFSDASRGVWGSHVAGSPSISQLAGPAQVTSSTAGWEQVTTTVAVLPEGADDVQVAPMPGADTTFDSVTLDGRPVVLQVVKGDTNVVGDEFVSFSVGGEQYDLAGYLQDLNTLSTADGSGFSVAVDRQEAGAVTLRRHSDGELIHLTEGGEGLVSGIVDGSLVVAASGWDAGSAVLTESRVELMDGASASWVTPTDVAQAVLDDGTLVTVLAVSAEDGATLSDSAPADLIGLDLDGDGEPDLRLPHRG